VVIAVLSFSQPATTGAGSLIICNLGVVNHRHRHLQVVDFLVVISFQIVFLVW